MRVKEESRSGAEDLSSIVGRRLRGLRRVQGLTLEEVARKADLSHSFVSLVERGRADISLRRLHRLANVFGVRVGELLLEEGGPRRVPSVFTREDMLSVSRGRGVDYRVLSNTNPAGLQLIHADLGPRRGFKDVLVHKGFDVCFVIQGPITLSYGDKKYELLTNQVAVFEGVEPHTFSNRSNHSASFVAVTTVPYW